MNTTTQTIPTGTLKNVPLKDITVPERFRKDFGDMAAFVETIKEKGILQPITLSSDLTLLAGGRRFKGASMAGLDKIPALIRKVEPDEIDYREVELMENIERKDFTWQERVAATAEIDRLYKGKNYEWSGRKTAELLSKGTMTVARDLELANAIKVLPELALQATASDAYKMLKKFEETAVVDELRKRQILAVDGNEDVQGLDLEGTVTFDDKGEPIAVTRVPNWQYTPDMKARIRIADSSYRIGDTFKGLAELRNDGVIHLIECDPPYGIDLVGVKGSKDSVDSNVHSYEEIPADKYNDFLIQLTHELYRVAGKDCWLVFWFGPTWHTQVKAALKAAKWHVDDIPAIWNKTQGQTLQPEIYLARAYEPFFLCRKGAPYMANRGRLNVFSFSGTPSTQKYHPTERPLLLIEEILRTLGVARQTVLVPFLGSGATLRACYKLNMSGFGWDMNPDYKDRFMLAVEDDAKEIIKQLEDNKEETT